MLNDPRSSRSPTSPDLDKVTDQLCHPLCFCDKCSSRIKQSQQNSPNSVTVFSRDDQGATGA